MNAFEARTEKAKRELRSVKNAETQLVGQANPIVDERVTQRFISHAIVDRDAASMFAIEAAKTRSYEQGFHDGRKVEIQKNKKKLAEEVYGCENYGFKHRWVMALQAAEALRVAGIDLASPLYQSHHFPFATFEVEKSNDEGDAD